MPLSKAKQAEWMRNYRANRRGLGITAKKVIPVKEVKSRLCHACSESRVLDSHHVDGDRSNNNEWNLVDLCPTCHTVIHRLGVPLSELTTKPVIPNAVDNPGIVGHDADGYPIYSD